MKPISHYQNILNDEHEDPKRKNSAYWNEGKWKNYIEPLLPTENRQDMTFIDIGASNGLFCKLAQDAGFRDIIGIENDYGAVIRGHEYRDSFEGKYNYKLLNLTVGRDFVLDDMPVADVVLISNVHYYFDLKDWLKLVDQLYWKTEYVLIITRPFKERRDSEPLVDIDSIKHYFRDWELVRARYRVRQRHMEHKGDPKPRVLHSMLFRSRLRRKSLIDLIPGSPADPIKIDRAELIQEIKDQVPIQDMRYYKAWKERMYPKRWNKDQLYDFVHKRITNILDIQGNGVKEPILITADHKVIDGKHRVETVKDSGYNSIICRMI